MRKEITTKKSPKFIYILVTESSVKGLQTIKLCICFTNYQIVCDLYPCLSITANMNFNSKEPHESHFLPSCLETPVVDAPVGCEIEGHDVAAARVGAAWFSVSAKRL